MIKITNHNRHATVNFVTGIKDSLPVTDSVKAGETKNVNVDPDDRNVQALVHAGQITIGKEDARRPAGKPDSPAA